jgi:hypothetical protein
VSNRRKIRQQNPAEAMLAAMDGARIDGGCPDCDAYREIQATAIPGVSILHVWHDDWCPSYGAVGGGRPAT